MSGERTHPDPEFWRYVKGRIVRVKRLRPAIPGVPFTDDGKEAVVEFTTNSFVWCRVEGWDDPRPYHPEELVRLKDRI